MVVGVLRVFDTLFEGNFAGDGGALELSGGGLPVLPTIILVQVRQRASSLLMSSWVSHVLRGRRPARLAQHHPGAAEEASQSVFILLVSPVRQDESLLGGSRGLAAGPPCSQRGRPWVSAPCHHPQAGRPHQRLAVPTSLHICSHRDC